MLKIATMYDINTPPEKLMDFSRQIFPCSATRAFCWYLPQSSGGWIRNDQNSDKDA